MVVVGAGPGGLEARASGGHAGEPGDGAGGRVAGAGRYGWRRRRARRREVLGVVRWREEQCAKLGVTFRFNTLAEADTVLALDPDVVIVATGGLPQVPRVAGDEFCVTGWDILSGDAAPGAEVLVYDEAGDFTGLQAAEKVAESGGRVEVVTADRSFAPEVMGMSLTPYVRALQAHGTRSRHMAPAVCAARGEPAGGHFGQRLRHGDRGAAGGSVVLNHGTMPLDELYFALKPLSRNLGQVDYPALVEGAQAALEPNLDGRFRLFRIGDAVESRNIHAAVFDGLRFAMGIDGKPVDRRQSCTARRVLYCQKYLTGGFACSTVWFPSAGTAAAWFRELRDEIVAAFEGLEDSSSDTSRPAGRFEVTETKRHSDDGSDAVAA